MNVWFNCLRLQQGRTLTRSLLILVIMLISNFASVQMIMFCHRVHKVSNQLPQLTFPKGAQPRIWHTVTALSLGPGRTQVIMFGGCPKWEWGKTDNVQQKLAETTVLEFGEQNTYAVLTSSVSFWFSGFSFS